MSEDSIASDSVSCRSEANAPLLPPRKRLLAGFKQNGWPSPSSSSCAPAAYEPPRAKETFEHVSATKAEVLDQNSGDAADGEFHNGRGSLQSLNGAAESLDSHSKSQRKPKRRRASSPLTMKKFAKKKKKKSASPESDEHLSGDAVDVVKSCLVGDKIKLSVASLTSSELEEHSIALIGGEEFIEEKEERFTTANGEVSAELPTNVKPGSYSGSVNKEEEVATCDEAPKRSRNPARKTLMDSEKRSRADATTKHRKTSNGQKQKKMKKAGHKKLDMQPEKVVLMPLPLADEELARQLHRAMNSSPRIARCLSS